MGKTKRHPVQEQSETPNSNALDQLKHTLPDDGFVTKENLSNTEIERQEPIEKTSETIQRTKRKRDKPNLYINEISEIRLKMESEEAPIVRLVNDYIAQAIAEGASDIHLDPKKDSMEVRFRIDGHLYKRHALSSNLTIQTITRIKIMSGLDIAQKRFPQEGLFHLKIKEMNVDIHVSTFPSLYGENVVLKVSHNQEGIFDLSKIGLYEEHQTIFVKSIQATRGLILATGPSGSGKTTTIYSLINALNKNNKKIITIEDPIANEIEGIVQSQIDPARGLTFANALRSILCQDPDIIYLGEIRDRETATIAIRAALTGQLVFSTLHTHDTVGTITRLRDIGIQEGLIELVLNCSFAQRLVRKLCTKCRQKYAPDNLLLEGLALPLNTPFYREKGCADCNNTGYKGRTALFEILTCNRQIKALISNNAPEHEIAKAARSNGMKSLFEDGLRKIVQGITTLDEVKKATEEIWP